MRAVDTNVLVRLLVRDDAKQLATIEAFLGGGPAWVSHLVLVETIWVLDSVYDVKAPQLAEAVQMLLDHDGLSVQDDAVVAAALGTFRRHPQVGFSDCLVLEVARKAGHQPVATFDRALARIDGAERLRA
jgi:predicted nucleic-acid-binding protein